MKVNFDIIDNYTLSIEGKHLDLHNNLTSSALNIILGTE